MKKILFIIIITFLACSENCDIDNVRLSELGAEAEAKRIEISEASTVALKNVLQLQLDQLTSQMDAVANECN